MRIYLHPLFTKLRPPALIQLLLVVVLIAVFFPVCSYDFINYDDNINVYENDRIVDFSLSNLLYFWKGPYQGLYIPLAYSVWGVLAKLSMFFPATASHHLQPGLFHLVNLLLHGASAMLLFHILRRLVHREWAAGAGALLFACHPVQVEAVAWVTGLKDVLSGFFSLLALWHYLALGQRCEGQRSPVCTGSSYVWATLFFTAAMLTKPSVVTLPLMLALLGYLLLDKKKRSLALELSPWLIAALAVVVITRVSQPEVQTTYAPTFWQRFLVAGDAISFYLGKILLPATLAPGYGRDPETVLGHGWVYGTAIIPLLLALLLLWKYRKPWVLASSGIFVLAILPVLGFVRFDFQSVSTVADRYLYVAMVGPALALSYWLASQQAVRNWLIGVIGVVFFLLAVKSATQVRHWQNSIVFHSYAVMVNPKNSASYNNLGIALKEANRNEEATVAFKKAMNLDPKLIRTYNDQRQSAVMPTMSADYYKSRIAKDPSDAEAYFSLGDIARANSNATEALDYYLKGLALKPDFAVGYANLGLVYVTLNNTEKAVTAYRKAVQIDPDFAEVYSNLGLLFEEQDRQEAVLMYEKALSIKPGLGEAANNLGYLYLGMKKEKEAIPLLQQAITVYPENPLPYNNLGQAFYILGRYEEAANSFSKAVEVEPTYAPALNNLSKTKLQLGDIPSALEYADKAKALGFNDPLHFEALRKHRR